MAYTDPIRAAYNAQRCRAKQRGISWQFTFESWLAAWRASGKMHLRGRGRGYYVMARPGDAGPYSPENVVFITFEQNCIERTETAPIIPPPASTHEWGRGKGWRLTRNRRNPYQAKLGKKTLGHYATPDEARAVYLAAAAALALDQVQS